MPDFFVDRIVKMKSWQEFHDRVLAKASRGGGSIRGIESSDRSGGNAVNVSYCLARLGFKVSLFTCADLLGNEMLRQAFSQFGPRADLRISRGRQGLTTSFEFLHGGSAVNVMVSDIKDMESFGPEKLAAPEDLTILKNADAVMVVNWASNLKGTDLAEYAFANSSSGLHFIDPADIETRNGDFRDSLAKLAPLVDALAINESECNSLGEALGLGSAMIGSGFGQQEVREAAKKISEKIGITVDLHTKAGSAWSNGRETEFAHVIKVEPKMITGAGDSWDAGDIVGYLAGLEPRDRLLFANACASLYVRNAKGEPPIMEEVFELVDRIR